MSFCEERHVREIEAVLAVSAEQLDLQYLEQWAARLGVLDLWERVQSDAEPSEDG